MPNGSEHPRASAAVWDPRSGGARASAAEGAARARRRGLVRGALGLSVAAVLVLWHPTLGAVAGAVALVVLLLALLAPGTLYPRLEVWIAALARGVGMVVSQSTLTVVHLLVFVPLGVLLRATGSLRITTDLDRRAPTYWRPPDSTARHDRQF